MGIKQTIIEMGIWWYCFNAHVLVSSRQAKLVGRYLHQKADQPEGLKLNSRYAPLADIRDSSIDLNNGRGDEHQGLYLGLSIIFVMKI